MYQVGQYLSMVPKEYIDWIYDTDPDKPDLEAIKKLKLGKIIRR